MFVRIDEVERTDLGDIVKRVTNRRMYINTDKIINIQLEKDCAYIFYDTNGSYFWTSVEYAEKIIGLT